MEEVTEEPIEECILLEYKDTDITELKDEDNPTRSEIYQSTSDMTELSEMMEKDKKNPTKSFFKNSNLTREEIMNLSPKERAEVCLEKAMEIIRKQRKVLSNLRLKKWRIIKRMNTLKSVVETLQKNNINSEKAQEAIRVYKSMSKSYAGWRKY